MKTLSKKVLLICLLALTVVFAALFTACAGDKPQEEPITYTVTVVDDSDAPVKDVKVYLSKGSARYDNLTTDAEGKATVELAADTYDVNFIASTLPEGYNAPVDVKVTKDEPSVTAKLVKQFRYVVKLVDEEGNPFYRENAPIQVAICGTEEGSACTDPKFIDANGVYSTTLAPAGNYKVQIIFSSALQDEYTYEGLAPDNHYYSGEFLSATKTELTVVIKKATSLILTGEATKTIKIESADKSFTVIFQPSQTGIYEITSEGAYDTKAVYYASSASMIKSGEDDDSGEGKNFKISDLEYKEVGPSSAFVITVKEGAQFPASFNVKITRTGDAQEIVERQPQKVTPAELGDSVYEGTGNYYEVDLTSTQTIVKGTDGYYHLDSADGLVLVVKLAKPFRDFGSFTAQQQGGRAASQSYFMAFSDYESETIFWDYTEFLTAYQAKCNTDGVYGVNDELKTMLERWAGYYIDETTFGIEVLGTIEKGNEWLIPCGYYIESTLTGEGTIDDQYRLGLGTFDISVPADSTVYFMMTPGEYTVTAISEGAFTLDSATGFSVTETEGGYTFNCASSLMGGFAQFTVTNSGNSAITVKFTATEQVKENGNALELGMNEVSISAEEYFDGAIFTFTPEEDGRYVISSASADSALFPGEGTAYDGDMMEMGFAFTVDAQADQTYSFNLGCVPQTGAKYVVVVNKELDVCENGVTIYGETDLFDGTVVGFSPMEGGKYVIYCTDVNTMLLYSDAFNGYKGDGWLEGFACVVELEAFKDYYFLLCATSTAEYYVTIAKYEDASLTVGDNNVTGTFFGNVYAFTAEESVTYKITSADANAALLSGLDFASEEEVSTVDITIEAEAGETYFLIFTTMDMEDGTYKVTVAKAPAENTDTAE